MQLFSTSWQINFFFQDAIKLESNITVKAGSQYQHKHRHYMYSVSLHALIKT